MYSVVYCITSANGMTTAEISGIPTRDHAERITSQIESAFSSFGRCIAVVIKVA